MAYTNRNFTWDFDALKRFYERYIVKWLNSAVSWTDAQKKQARANLGFGDGDIDSEPTTGSGNLVTSGGVYNSNNLFTLPMANKVIKELYTPGADYTTVFKIQLCIAAFHSEKYQNRVILYYTLNETSKQIIIYSKNFDTESEALEDISNMQGLQHLISNDYYAILGVDASMAGTFLWDTPISANKDFADLNNSPVLKGYIDSLNRFEGERPYYINTEGKVKVSSSFSKIFTTHVIASKKYKLVSEVAGNNRKVSFTSDFNGQNVVPHEVDGTYVAASSYNIGTKVFTAPAGAKYMHITTQYSGDTNNLPYVLICEYDNDIELFKNETNNSIRNIRTNIEDVKVYTEVDLSNGYYNNRNATEGSTFNTDTITSPTSTTTKCIKLRVKQGDIISLTTSMRTSTGARPYTLTNDAGIVIETSDLGGEFLTPPASITVENDGYLYINMKISSMGTTAFSLIIYSSKINKIEADITELQSKIIPNDENPLSIVKETAGLTSIIHKLGVIGASFTTGGHNITSGSFPTDIRLEFSWPQRLAKLCGNTAYNFGKPGMWSKAWLDDVGGYYTQMGQSDYACDAYVISFASNDADPEKADYPLGTIADVHIGNESENGASYYGYMSQIIARCHSVVPRSYLFMQTYPYNYAQCDTNGYNQAMRDLVTAYRAAGYYIYLIDYARYGMTISQAQNKGMYRGAHFVGTGYQYMAYEICTYIDWIIKHNMDDFKDIAFVQTDAEYV